MPSCKYLEAWQVKTGHSLSFVEPQIQGLALQAQEKVYQDCLTELNDKADMGPKILEGQDDRTKTLYQEGLQRVRRNVTFQNTTVNDGSHSDCGVHGSDQQSQGDN
jgi:hypothetical protein